jgi:hypothetical protein
MADNKEEQERKEQERKEKEKEALARKDPERAKRDALQARQETFLVGDYLILRAKDPKDNRVILWEKDELHPNGEAFVWGDPEKSTEEQIPFQAGNTPKVQKLIADGLLVSEGGGDPMMRR